MVTSKEYKEFILEQFEVTGKVIGTEAYWIKI